MRRKRKIALGKKRRRRIEVREPPDAHTRMKLISREAYEEAKRLPFARTIVSCVFREGKKKEKMDRFVPALVCYVHSQGLVLNAMSLDHDFYLDHCLGCTRWVDEMERKARGRCTRKIVLGGKVKTYGKRKKKIQA